MSTTTTRAELLSGAERLREQARRLRESAQYADSAQARTSDEDDARHCIVRAEQMEKDAAGLPPATVSNDFTFNLVHHLVRQRLFSFKTFGPGDRAQGIVSHIRKELLEIEFDPKDLNEWIDVVLLAFDGALRAGHEPGEIAVALSTKLAINERCTWPDWRKVPEGAAIEHVRSEAKEHYEIPAFLRRGTD
jgi:hypothetical protein